MLVVADWITRTATETPSRAKLLEQTEILVLINNIVMYFYIEVNMSVHFVYLWYDKSRKMFYVGQHSGSYDDSYTSSSRWLSGEITYRPKDFKRRIIKTFNNKNEAQQYEGFLLTLIKPSEFGTKYYNKKQGKPAGTAPWNKGKTGIYTTEQKKAMSERRKGVPTIPKGTPNPKSAENGRKGALKLSAKAKGRKKKILPDGSWTWVYPTTSVTEQVGTISES